MSTAQERIIEACKKHGLDVRRMLADGADLDGYDEAQVDEEGRRIIDGRDGSVVTVRREWPSREAAEEILALHAAWQGRLAPPTRRPSGVKPVTMYQGFCPCCHEKVSAQPRETVRAALADIDAHLRIVHEGEES